MKDPLDESPVKDALAFRLGSMEATLTGVARDVSHIRKQVEAESIERAKMETRLRDKIGEVEKGLDEKIDSLGTRVGKLEHWRTFLLGAFVLLTALLDLLPRILEFTK